MENIIEIFFLKILSTLENHAKTTATPANHKNIGKPQIRPSFVSEMNSGSDGNIANIIVAKIMTNIPEIPMKLRVGVVNN